MNQDVEEQGKDESQQMLERGVLCDSTRSVGIRASCGSHTKPQTLRNNANVVVKATRPAYLINHPSPS